MEEEFAFHVDMESARLRAEGMPPGEARRRALVTFGGLERYREEMRDGRGARALDDATADVRYAVRMLRRSPGFTVAIALTLGVGIGLNGFTYGLVDSMLFRPVPARAPHQLVGVFPQHTRTGQIGNFAYNDYQDFREKSGAFAELAGMTGVPLNLVADGRGVADMVWGEMVTENFFSVLGTQPAIGRFFTAQDAPRGANAVAVLSYAAWQDRFGRDPGIVGRAIRINGTAFTVTGVAPEGFKGLRSFGFWPELWVSAGMHTTIVPGSEGWQSRRGRGSFILVGRMHEGWDVDGTAAVAASFARHLAQTFPATNRELGVIVLPARSGFDNPQVIKPRLLVLASALGIAGTVLTLVVICANLANLQLARTASRSREFAIRLSLGCSRPRLIKQLLVETLVAAVPGLGLAALFVWAAPLIEPLLLPRLPFRVGMGVAPNIRVALFTSVISLTVVVVLGLIPIVRVNRTNCGPSLTAARPLRRLRHRPVSLRSLLVVSQLAISVVLLVGGTLFARSFFLARTSGLGFDERDRLLVSVNLGLQGYDAARGRRFYEQVLERVRAEAGVVSATWAFPVPFDMQDRRSDMYETGASAAGESLVRADVSVVGDDFVEALGLRLMIGRGIESRDSAGAPLVMVVSRALAARLSPTVSVLGKRVRVGSATGADVTVVGVVDDATFQSLGNGSVVRAYLPLRQHYRDWQTLVVHMRGPAMSALPRIRGILAAADPLLPPFGAGTLRNAVDSGRSSWRVAAIIAAAFGTLAALIAAIGLHAVVASTVTERTREIGVRIALGSTPRGVMHHVMAHGFRLGAWGLVCGLAGAFALARTMARLLFGLAAFDAVTFVAVPLALFVMVLAATYVPARRAVKLEPMTALRTD
jgi:predicted permease